MNKFDELYNKIIFESIHYECDKQHSEWVNLRIVGRNNDIPASEFKEHDCFEVYKVDESAFIVGDKEPVVGFVQKYISPIKYWLSIDEKDWQKAVFIYNNRLLSSFRQFWHEH